MSDIRKYIEIVEGFGVRAQPQQAFGRAGTAIYQAPEPSDPDVKEELDRCRKYRSADDYANAENEMLPVHNYDTKEVRYRADKISSRLRARWNSFKQAGLIR